MFHVKFALCFILLAAVCQSKPSWKKKGCWIAPLENGSIVEPKNSKRVAIGGYIKYSCDDGYELKGLRRRKCTKTKKGKKLGGKMPECQAIPVTTLPPTTLPPLGCYYNGRYHAPGTVIEEVKTDEGVICSTVYCDESGHIFIGDNFAPECHGHPPTTTPFPFPGCEYNGKFYEPGSVIEEVKTDEGIFCYGTYCDESGQVIHGDSFAPECEGNPPTTTHPLPPTTTPPLLGCEYNGNIYEPGSVIEEVKTDDGIFCYGTYCDESGQVIHGDSFAPECEGNPILPPTTTPPKTTTPPLGCEYNGKIYGPGVIEMIDHGVFCSTIHCDESFQVVIGDEFNCKPTTIPTTTLGAPIEFLET